MHLDALREAAEEAERFLEKANELLQVADNPDVELCDEDGWIISNENSRSLRRRSMELTDSLRRMRRTR